MASEIFPRTAKVAAFPTCCGFPRIHVIAPLQRRFPKTANPLMLARTLLTITSHVHCPYCFLSNSNNIIKSICDVLEWYNCQLLQPVHIYIYIGSYIRRVIDCNEWETEKRHECAKMGNVKRLKLWWQLYRTSLPVRDLENFWPMDFCWTECTWVRGTRHSYPPNWCGQPTVRNSSQQIAKP